MVRPLMTDTVFLAQKAQPADAGDVAVADDLLDTLKAHEDGCVGMAANMIGVNKAIIVFDNDGTPLEMFNPVILYRKGLYLAEEGCLSLQGQRKNKRHRTIKVQWPGPHHADPRKEFYRLDGANHPARGRPLQRHSCIIR